ncbi:hypothetical protein BYT27DRAFT_6601517 [Phlegmacium glaucopus]|nr:hypothetical protein BYT27DRAFT_6601517 [Phlegmacium glaucopus]
MSYSSWSDDAFPNSETLFNEAFVAVDPVPPLLQLLKQHPEYRAVRDLAISYHEAVEANPYRGNFLAEALVILINSPLNSVEELAEFIGQALADLHFKYIYEDNAPREYGPKNSYLHHSLLSALSHKHKLTSTSDMLAAIDDGLDAPINSAESEVLVMGACIQLLLYGSMIVTNDVGSYKKRGREWLHRS